MPNEYTYRNLPCTSNPWYVSGLDRVTGAGGILEWCLSEADALNTMAQMNKDYRFTNLHVDLFVWEE